MSFFKNRRITEEQFEDSGTIDGSRIEKALAETEEYINNVPLEAIKERYSLNYMVFTSLGADWAGAAGDIYGDVIGQARNQPFLWPDPLRVKGSNRSTYDYLMPSALAGIWTVSAIFPRPVILDNVSLFINGTAADPAAVAGTPGTTHTFPMWNAGKEAFQRVRVIIDTDDAISAEDRSLNSKEYVLEAFQETFWATNYDTSGSTMYPATPEGATPLSWGEPTTTGTVGEICSVFLDKGNINVPLHQFARVRFRVLIYRDWANALGAGLGPLITGTPENVTFTVVYKEALKDG